jgi:hypothetical protein
MTIEPRTAAAAWLDGDLEGEDAAALAAQLAANPAAGADFADEVAIDGMLRAHAAPQAARAARTAVLAQLAARTRHRQWRWVGLASAACLLLALGALAISTRNLDRTPAAHVVQAQAATAGERDLTTGDSVAAATVVTTGSSGSAEFVLSDGSTVTLASNTRLVLGGAALPAVTLDHGEITCQVTPQAAGHEFAVHTAQAHIAVLGTRFVVREHDDRTTVDVTSGKVRVTPTTGGASHLLTPGERVSTNGSLVALGAPADPLPRPATWPMPPGASSLGGNFATLPWFTSVVAPAAPHVAAWSTSASAGGDVLLTGSDMGDVRRAWIGWPIADGSWHFVTCPATPHSAFATTVQLPPELGTGTIHLWPIGKAGSGAPVRLQAPEPWWLRASAGGMVPGGTLQVFGRGLNGVDAWLHDGSATWLPLTLLVTTAEALTVQLPTTATPGAWKLVLQRPADGSSGGCTPLPVTIIAQAWQRGPQRVRMTEAAGDRTAEIQAACDRLGAEAAGGTLELAAGRYELHQPLRIPAQVRVTGAGQDRTSLVLVRGPGESPWGIALHGARITISDLSIRCEIAGTWAYGPLVTAWQDTGEGLHLHQVRIGSSTTGRVTLDSTDGELSACDIALPVTLGGEGWRVAGNRLRTGLALSGSESVVTGNHLGGDPAAAEDPRCGTAIWNGNHLGSLERFYLADNVIDGFVAERHQRAAIALQAFSEPWSEVITNVTAETLSFAADAQVPEQLDKGDLDGNAWALILDGPGLGQARRVLRHICLLYTSPSPRDH